MTSFYTINLQNWCKEDLKNSLKRLKIIEEIKSLPRVTLKHLQVSLILHGSNFISILSDHQKRGIDWVDFEMSHSGNSALAGQMRRGCWTRGSGLGSVVAGDGLGSLDLIHERQSRLKCVCLLNFSAFSKHPTWTK